MHSINDDDDVLQYGTTKEPIDKQETKMEQDCCCGHPIYVQPVVGFIMVKFHYKVYRRINEVNNARQRPFKVDITFNHFCIEALLRISIRRLYRISM